MDGNGTRHGRHGRPTLRVAEAHFQRDIAPRERSIDVPNQVARPLLNTIGVLKLLRQVFRACQEQDAWRWPLKYDVAPDDGLSLTEYGIDELERALEALGELETLVKAWERGAAP
jgi:hypothetical protein